MKTNLEKYNHYSKLILERDKVFINQCLAIQKFDTFYKVNEWNGKIDILDVIGYSIDRNISIFWHSRKNPKNTDVTQIKTLWEAEIPLYIKDILVEVKERSGAYTTKYSIDKILDIPSIFSDEKKALELSEKISEQIKIKEDFERIHKKDKYYPYAANGYKYLGWANGWDKNPDEVTNCYNQKHMRIEVSHNMRGSEHTVSCPVCMIYWKYDSSD